MIKHKAIIGLGVLCILLTLLSAPSKAQKGNASQQYLTSAIQKAYPACVRMWGFDLERNERTSAQFSGVVVTANGIILTAAHTVLPGKTYKVFFPDGKEVIAKALGRIDLAASPGIPDAGMMQIMGQGSYPFAEMGFVNDKSQDQACMSISYPERLNQALPTLRYGKVAEVKNEYGFLRSTCKMEPGDSGGGLFDQLGRLIGLHSAIDVSEEMNFEIPVNIYRKYWTALQEQVNYTEYPVKEDHVDLSKITNADYQLDQPIDKLAKSLAKKGNSSFRLTSNIEGVEVSAIGTLLNYVASSSVKGQFILSKSTIIADQPYLWTGGVKIPLFVVKRDLQNDLVLLKAPQKLNGGITLADETASASIGTFVVATLPDGNFQRGVLGNDSITLDKSSSLPYLGASVLFKSSPVTVTVVKPGSPAALAGIQHGDFITSINKVVLKHASEFAPELSKYWAGDEVAMTWHRGSQTFSKTITFKSRPFVASNHPVDQFSGGVSERRDGFKQVFVHDATLLPNQYGGPVFNINGQFLGINIARYSRAISLGIPQMIIHNFIKEATDKP